jgi:hypothetical protein
MPAQSGEVFTTSTQALAIARKNAARFAMGLISFFGINMISSPLHSTNAENSGESRQLCASFPAGAFAVAQCRHD